MRKIASIILSLVFMAVSPAYSLAEVTQTQTPKAAYPRLEPPFSNGIGTQTTEENYVASILSYIRQNGRDPNKLDRIDIEKIKQRNLANRRAMQVSSFLEADLNNDGKVTRAEAEQYLSGRTRNSVGLGMSANRSVINATQSALDEFMKADTNRDGVISYDEMRHAAQGNTARFGSNDNQTTMLEKLVDTAPDGTLTVAELEKQARAVFESIDLNHDSIISQDEMAAYQSYKASLAQPSYLGEINPSLRIVPRPSDDNEKIILVSASTGNAYSSVALNSQYEDTRVIHVNIEEGDDPLYVILTNYTPCIWRFEGAVQRVKHVLAGSDSGVTGVAKDKVTFAATQGLVFEKAESSQAAVARSMVNRFLGRAPDRVAGVHAMVSVNVPSGMIDYPKRLPQYNKIFDQQTWNEMIKYVPGGAEIIDPLTVISPRPVELYTILPSLAGVAQLVHAGKLRRIDGSFEIIEHFDYFPAKLSSGMPIRFLLAKGVVMPGSTPGTSCVIIEETGKILAGTGCGN